MKKAAAAALAATLFFGVLLCSCAPRTPEPATAAPAVSEPATAPAATVPETAPPTTVPPETLPPEETTAVLPAPAPTAAAGTEASVTAEVDLSVSLPPANGVMEVSLSADHPLIQAVTRLREIDPALLAAVYAVPESGQDYVFEFYSAGGRSDRDLRRVYLLDAAGGIRAVAAADAGEREQISAVENWFCMNVLIKRMILPSIADRLG